MSGPAPPSGLKTVFPMCTRFTETDEHPANARAEALIQSRRQQGWSQIHSMCFAHKIHSSATKTWKLPSQARIITGIIHTGKHLTTAGTMKQLKDTITGLVDQRLELRVTDAHDGVRDAVLKFFTPSRQQPRKRALVLAVAEFFNGAWGKQKTLQHVCHGCCPDRDAAVATAKTLLRKLASALLGRVLSRANWAQWSHSLQWFAFASALHGLVIDAFQMTFQKDMHMAQVLSTHGTNDDVIESLFTDNTASDQTAETPKGAQQADASHEDSTAKQRLENAVSCNLALHFLTPQLWKDIYLMQAALFAQNELMATILHATSQDWEHAQHFSLIHTGCREYRLLMLNRGHWLQKFYKTGSSIFQSAIAWSEFHETEELRSTLLQLFMRSMATVFQLVQVRVQGYPYKLLQLLDVATKETAALAAEQAPLCMQDRWTRQFP